MASGLTSRSPTNIVLRPDVYQLHAVAEQSPLGSRLQAAARQSKEDHAQSTDLVCRVEYVWNIEEAEARDYVHGEK